MDLTARENIYLNGTVLGFSPKYLDEKFDEIVEFSELQNFCLLYTSGCSSASTTILCPTGRMTPPPSPKA